MKGSIFQLFEKFVCDRFGADAYEHILDRAHLATVDPFIGPGTYPAEDLVAMIDATSAESGATVEATVRAFGRFAFPHLAASVPHAMAAVEHPRELLEQLDGVIHTEVRKVEPEARPPRVLVEHLDDRTSILHYRSPLRMLPMVQGLLDGVGDWYGEPFDHELLQADGDSATFRLTFTTARVATGGSTWT